MLSLQQELFGNTVRKVGKVRKVRKVRKIRKIRKVRKVRRTKTFIFKNKKIPGEKFVVRFDLNQIKRHLSGKAKPSDKFVVVKRILNNKVIEQFGIEHFSWLGSVFKTVTRVVKKVAKKAYKKAKQVAKKAVKAVKKVAKKAISAMKKGLSMLKGIDPRQIAKLMSIFKNQQKAIQNAEAKKQAALVKVQKAKWMIEEKREAAERRRIEAELARNKTDDTVKTKLPKFDTSTIKDINIGPKVSSSLGNSKDVNPPKINYSMNVKESPGSGEFGTNIKTMEDFTNIGPNNSFKICSIVLLLLLVFLFYYYTA